MPAPRKYPSELRERAIRLVAEAREQEPDLSLTAAVKRIGPRVGINVDTLRGWCKQADIDAGRAPGTTTSDGQRIRQLEQEVRELKRANEILLAGGCRTNRSARGGVSCAGVGSVTGRIVAWLTTSWQATATS
jgi:transposase-like protein